MHPFEKPFYGELYKGDGNMLEQFQPISLHGFQESASITISHFCAFSISVHPFQNLFYGEMHMGDSSLP